MAPIEYPKKKTRLKYPICFEKPEENKFKTCDDVFRLVFVWRQQNLIKV